MGKGALFQKCKIFDFSDWDENRYSEVSVIVYLGEGHFCSPPPRWGSHTGLTTSSEGGGHLISIVKSILGPKLVPPPEVGVRLVSGVQLGGGRHYNKGGNPLKHPNF